MHAVSEEEALKPIFGTGFKRSDWLYPFQSKATSAMVLIVALALANMGCSKGTRMFQWLPPNRDVANVASYNIKCGSTPGGPYPIVKSVTGTPPPTRYPVNQVLTSPGKYYCVVTATNAAGESTATNETVVEVK